MGSFGFGQGFFGQYAIGGSPPAPGAMGLASWIVQVDGYPDTVIVDAWPDTIIPEPPTDMEVP